MRGNALKRGFTGRHRTSWCVWGLRNGRSLPMYGWGHLWTFSGLSALTLLSVFYHPFFHPLPLLSHLFSPLSVDFSTSETKQTQSCVSGLVTLRALPDQHSCFFVCPPCSTFSTFLQQAPMPFSLLSVDLTTSRNGSKTRHVFSEDRNFLIREGFIFNLFI